MEEDNSGWWTFVIIGLIIWGAISLFSRDDNNYEPASSYSNSYEDYDYNDYSEDYGGYNPYNEGSGHYAGYEWAEENGVTDCGGNSASFIEGCEEYLGDQGY